MVWLDLLFAILAAFRLTTLFTSDAIWHLVRKRFPAVPWHCSLCMSIWAGCASTLFLAILPWLNWPLAISWLYLAYLNTTAHLALFRGPDMTPEKISEIRQNASVAFLQKVWEVTAQLGMNSTADAAQALADTAELRSELEIANKRIAELEADKTLPPPA